MNKRRKGRGNIGCEGEMGKQAAVFPLFPGKEALAEPCADCISSPFSPTLGLTRQLRTMGSPLLCYGWGWRLMGSERQDFLHMGGHSAGELITCILLLFLQS